MVEKRFLKQSRDDCKRRVKERREDTGIGDRRRFKLVEHNPLGPFGFRTHCLCIELLLYMHEATVKEG